MVAYNGHMSYKDREQQRKYQREWCMKRRQAFLQGKSCCQCGSTDHLEVDHIDPSQKISHRVWSWSATRREAELAKCQVLCHDCHLEKTRKEKSVLKDGSPVTHGTYCMYKDHGCRCDECRAANAKRNREQRARRRNILLGSRPSLENRGM